MKLGKKSNKSDKVSIGQHKRKEDLLRWLARNKKTAVAVPEAIPITPPPSPPTEALMVWVDDGGSV